MNKIRLAFLLPAVLLLTSAIHAATYTSVASGAWNSAAVWSPSVAGGPGPNDIVIINHTITHTTTSLYSGSATASITINSGGSLRYTGNLSLSGPGLNYYVKTGGSLSVAGTFNITNMSRVALQGGTLTVNNALVVNGGTLSTTAGSSATVAGLTVSSSTTGGFTNAGTFTSTAGVTCTDDMTNTGIMNVTGNFNASGIGTTINQGSLYVFGNVDFSSTAMLHTRPGGVTSITGNAVVQSNENLVIGTAVAPPPYADVIVQGDLISKNSGDILVDINGRLAVFGNFQAQNGGSLLTVKDGGHAYIGGTIGFTGTGSHLTNNNDGVPYGVYSPNQPTYSGGGSGSNGTAGTRTVQDIATMQSQDAPFYAWVFGLPNNPLPVTLEFFEVKEVNEQGVLLSWATSSEYNFDYFALHHSPDGEVFNKIADVPGHGTTNQRSQYTALDKKPFVGKNYYRLESVDYDGNTETFNVVMAIYEDDRNVIVYPVPMRSDRLHIHLNFLPASVVSVLVTDVSGTELYRAQFSGSNETVVPLALSKGVYFVQVRCNEIQKTIKAQVE